MSTSISTLLNTTTIGCRIVPASVAIPALNKGTANSPFPKSLKILARSSLGSRCAHGSGRARAVTVDDLGNPLGLMDAGTEDECATIATMSMVEITPSRARPSRVRIYDLDNVLKDSTKSTQADN